MLHVDCTPEEKAEIDHKISGMYIVKPGHMLHVDCSPDEKAEIDHKISGM